jgi:hypothetical protein
MIDRPRVETILDLILREFKAGVEADLLARMKAEVIPQLEEIAKAQAERTSESIIRYYKDERMMEDWLEWRIRINGEEVAR